MSRRSAKDINMTSQEDSKTASTEYLPILNMQPNKSYCNRRRCIIFSILVAILLVCGTIALILILTTGKSGGGGKDDPIEDNRPLNMFKFVNKQVNTNSISLELQSKVANVMKNDQKQNCVFTSVGKICESTENKFIQKVLMDVSILGTKTARIQFKDKDNEKRWDATKIPGFLGTKYPDVMSQIEMFGFKQTNEENFSFSIKDFANDEVVLDTTNKTFIMSDKFQEIGFILPTQILFGLGQSNSKFLLTEGNWTMFNRDRSGNPTASGNGKDNTYGSHPFLMCKTNKNKFIGILFYNSNAQQVSIKFVENSQSFITYKTAGGMLDIYFMLASSAVEVIQNYNNLIGKPTLPPFWALGFHQSSEQYESTKRLREVVKNYQSNGFMFDSIWVDNIYMDKYRDFTVGQAAFGDIKSFTNELHTNNLYCVPRIDAGIGFGPDSFSTDWFKTGQDMNVFIKSSKNPNLYNGTLIGKTDANYSAFVDFMHLNSSRYWFQGLNYLYDQFPYDGIWLGSNEPSNNCKNSSDSYIGECPPAETENIENFIERQINSLENRKRISINEFDNLQFSPGGEPLYTKTISLDAYHYDPNNNGTFTQFNMHNLYGTSQTSATNFFISNFQMRKPLVMSRSSFVGHGVYGYVWAGDNNATQEDMKLSINHIMRFSIFGIPFTGSNVCGYSGNTTPELCTRWAQVGSFYPFMRNHYQNNKSPQEFYIFDKQFQDGIKNSLSQRYSLLRYIYTCLYKSSIDGDPTIRHMMYDYPNIEQMVHNEDSFMIGKGIRVTANFDNSTDPAKFQSYFPQGKWVDYTTYQTIQVSEQVAQIELYNGWNYTNIHVKGGSIIPFQMTGEGSNIKKTADLLAAPIKLLIAPSDGGYAEGFLYLAKGELLDEQNQYFSISHSNKVIQFRQIGGYDFTGSTLDEIRVVGDQSSINSDFICGLDKSFNSIPLVIKQAQNSFSNETYISISKSDGTGISFDSILSISYGKIGQDFNFCDKSYTATKDHETQFELGYKLKQSTSKSNDSVSIIVTAKLISNNIVQVNITDDSGKRFEVPRSALSSAPFNQSEITRNINDFVTIDASSKFSLTIHEFQNSNNVYFKIKDNSLLVADYYLSMDTQINTNGNLFGLGERVTSFFLKEGIYTSWTKDNPSPYDNGNWPGENVYGSHPVYFTRSKSGNNYFWGMLNLNANAQDTKILYSGELGGQISHFITGQGIFEQYFFLDHKNPESAIKSYHKLIGYPLLPPLWGLGWHQSRYGYESVDVLDQVVQNYTQAGIPLDVLWSDIDHMNKYRTFTFDSQGPYKGLDEFIENKLHKESKRYVPIVDAGIAVVNDDSYPIFDSGKKEQVFIMSGNKNQSSNSGDDIIYGKVWPGYSAFVDHTKESANQWWIKQLNDFNSIINYDGIWLDMNEVANFCTGACVIEDVVPFDKSVKSKLVYTPGVNSLEEKSLSLDAVHSDGQTELNYHSLFGLLQGVTSSKYFTNKNKRPFIISRSTFVGQGKYTSHWLGDNTSSFDYLKYSISGIFNMNVFGINFVGADICGFFGDTTDNLCQKWSILGAFYPFARNHNTINARSQEPYFFSTDIQKNIKNAIRWRYSLLRYFYTELYINSIEGGTFWKPLFFEFPDDKATYQNIERNIMIGKSLKFSPMIDEVDAKTQQFIFTQGLWCNIVQLTCKYYSSTTSDSLPTTPDSINLHLRQGRILPIQQEALQNSMSVEDLKSIQTSFIILLDKVNENATGRVMFDDGETYSYTNSQKNQKTNTNFNLISDSADTNNEENDDNGRLDITLNFSMTSTSAGVLTFTAHSKGYTAEISKLNKIQFLASDYFYVYRLTKAKVNGSTQVQGTYNSSTKVLEFKFGGIDINTIDKIEFST